MPQTFSETRVPLGNMTFSPDVPSAALGPNEYNSGQNVETDTRGIRSVYGDETILATIPGQTIFVTGGYRSGGEWWYIVCSLVMDGVLKARWYGLTDTGGITNLTPGRGVDPNAFLTGYSYEQSITDTWNGTTLIINDDKNAPMYLFATSSEFKFYSQNSKTYVTTSAAGTGTTATLGFATQPTAPFTPGDTIVVAGVQPAGYNGTYTVTACTTAEVSYLNATTGPQTTAGAIVTNYQWNYTPGWNSVRAGFVRMYNTPNVGSLLIAGNLTADLGSGVTENYPATVQWSQAFGQNDVPVTWTPTITNVANQLEVPVRGPVVDGFPCAGNFYVCSYWDTVVFSPISYQGTNYPVLGVRLLNQGRGLLNENCWANADNMVYGLDARDIWSFDGNNFKPIGNQRIKNYFYDNLNAAYSNRVFVINNTKKYQIEIYYPDLNSSGWCNKMISYRYDLDCWNAPRDIDTASHATEGPLYGEMPDGSTLGYNNATRTAVYSRAVSNNKLVQKDQGTTFLGPAPIASEFRRDNISLGLKYSQQALIHRVLPEVCNIDDKGLQIDGVGNITIAISGSNSVGNTAPVTTGSTIAIGTDNPWIQAKQNAYRIYTVIANNVSSTDTWQCTAINWQFTPTQDAR
jgi:hypothetical protein